METEDVFEYTPFVNEECGDTMWNDENLNPPGSKVEKLTLLETSKTEKPENHLPVVEKTAK